MYEKNYRRHGSVSVYVVNSPKVAEAFAKLIGETTGHIDINSVDSGKTLPDKKYDLIYLNDLKYVEDAKKYADKYRSVLVTGKKSLVQKASVYLSIIPVNVVYFTIIVDKILTFMFM